MTIQYMHLSYEDYKDLERQMREFKETTHKTEGGFYHKSIRLRIGDLIVEYHGPLVGGYGHDGNGDQPPLPLSGMCPLCKKPVATGTLLPCCEDGEADPGCPQMRR